MLDVIDAALVHVSLWVETFSDEQEEMTDSLEGWIGLLRSDWGKPVTKSRQEARDYSWRDATSTMEFWANKVSKLRAAQFSSDADIYLEIWGSLPTKWQETIPMEGSLSSLRSILRQKELASGWPLVKSNNFGAYKNKSTDNGGKSKPEEKNTRFKDSSTGSKTRSNAPIPDCQICKANGKASQKHWHRDCPDRQSTREKSSHLQRILESDDEDEQRAAAVPDESSEASEGDTSHTVNRISRVWSPTVINAVLQDKYKPETFAKPRVFDAVFQEDAIFGEGNLFHKNGAAMIYARSQIDSEDRRYCWDTGTGPTVGNASYCKELFPNVPLQRRQGKPLRVRAGFDGDDSRYVELREFLAVTMYMPSTKGNLLAFKVEIHLTDAQIDSNILFGTATMRSNQIICDFAKETLRASAIANGIPQTIKIPLYLRERRELVESRPVYAADDLAIGPGEEGVVRVDLSSLPDRDFMFTGKENINIRKGIHTTSPRGIVDATCKRAIVTNFGDYTHYVKKGDLIGFLHDLAADSEYTVTQSTSKDDYSRPFMLRDFRSPPSQ